ncbi:MAG: cytochrome C [Rhodomicrobium sp.]
MIALRGGVPNASRSECVAAGRSSRFTPLSSWSSIAAGLFFLMAGETILPPAALAVPAYARQTGQTCATCHTAWPELTPYGRQFKLTGYTAGGTRCGDGSAETDKTQVPLAVMAWPATYTSYRDKAANPSPPPGNFNDNEWISGQFSLFVAGQLYCDVGSFAQMTYDRSVNAFGWDNTDIRYAKTGVIDGTDIVYGITANNNPSVQDVWNTTPAWFFPYITSEVAPTPANGTMLVTDQFGAQVGGVGGYVWINNSIYAEFTAYGALPPRLATDLGADPTANRFSDAAPYWRVAYEKTWDRNSLMFGTIGMYADQQITNAGLGLSGTGSALATGITDPTLDLGVDTQYQWIGDEHIFTVRGLYVWQTKKNNIENHFGANANASDELNDLNVSATYIYDRKYSFTAGYFDTWGTSDVNLYGTPNGSPNSSGWNLELAYLPFMKGGPDLWPWFNARIGVLYTHYDEFNGTSGAVINPVNGIPVKASGNDTVFFYTWLMF